MLVGSYEDYCEAGHFLTSFLRVRRDSSSFCTACDLAVRPSPLNVSTMLSPGIIRGAICLNASRSMRLPLTRICALPCFLPTAQPNDTHSFSSRKYNIRTSEPDTRAPVRNMRSNSQPLRSTENLCTGQILAAFASSVAEDVAP